MKKLVLFTLLAIISQPSLLSQSIEEDITYWKEVLNELNQRKRVLSDSIDIVNQLIDKLIFEKNVGDVGKPSFDVEVTTKGKIVDKPSPFGEVVLSVNKGEIITIFEDTGNGYWSCKSGKSVGYINDVYFNLTDDIKDFFSAKEALEAKADVERAELIRVRQQMEMEVNAEAEEEARRQLLTEAKAEIEEARRAKIIQQAALEERFGKDIANRIDNNQYWLGMTAEMARLSLGSPDDINRSVGSFGVHEQWVYEKRDLYLYFEGGKLTSWQD